jgi:AcrR family transcriptional regulator
MGRSPSARTRSARTSRRRSLTKERVVRAAIQLLDERGLEALTMRDLAASLGAGAMSLYNHVASKEEVLSAHRHHSSSARKNASARRWNTSGSSSRAAWMSSRVGITMNW